MSNRLKQLSERRALIAMGLPRTTSRISWLRKAKRIVAAAVKGLRSLG